MLHISMPRRRTTAGRAWFVGLVVILVVAVGLVLFTKAQREKLASLKSSIAQLKEEHVPLRFQIASRSEHGLKTKIKLYDMDDTEITTTEIAMEGESLFWDFVCVPVAGKYIAFPNLVFTEVVPAEQGLSLFSYYDRDGFPQVFAKKDMSESLKADLRGLFSRLKQGGMPSDAFGNAVHDIKEFKSFETGIVYKVVARLQGGIEIVEDEP